MLRVHGTGIVSGGQQTGYMWEADVIAVAEAAESGRPLLFRNCCEMMVVPCHEQYQLGIPWPAHLLDWCHNDQDNARRGQVLGRGVPRDENAADVQGKDILTWRQIDRRIKERKEELEQHRLETKNRSLLALRH